MQLLTNRQVIRTPVNPLDKSTIISAFPKTLDETKITLQPGRFIIPAAPPNDITVSTFGTSSWFKELEEDQPLVEMVVSSVEIARSIIEDYCIGLLGCDMATAMPALFWVPGAFTKEEVKIKFKKELAESVTKQENYFKALVGLADAFWVGTGGQSAAISDDMRMAAKQLNLIDKPWLKDSVAMELVKCVACKTLINSDVIVCPNCKVVVNAKKFKELSLEFAK